MAEPIPDELDALEQHAAWAQRFKGGTTNPALRERHGRDVEDYGKALIAERERIEMEEIRNDRTKQNFYFQTEELKLKRTEAEQQFQHRAELHPLVIETKIAQANASRAKERKDAAATLLQEQEALVEREDSTGFSTTVLGSKARPGTPEYERAVLEAHLKHPAADKNIVASSWKSANSRMTFEDAFDAFKAAQAAAPNATITSSTTGNLSITAPAQEKSIRTGLTTELTNEQRLHSEAVKLLGTKATDENRQLLEDNVRRHAERIAALESQIGGNVPPAAAPSLADLRTSKDPTSDFEAIPSGTEFFDPKGIKRRKP